jgi:hypothetical protein
MGVAGVAGMALHAVVAMHDRSIFYPMKSRSFIFESV